MSFSFDMSDPKSSLERIYKYVADLVGEKTWQRDPILSDTPGVTLVKFPHPDAKERDVKSNSEPFSSIDISMGKPPTPVLQVGISYSSKKAAAHFYDMLTEQNNKICDELFMMINGLNGFEFKVQLKTNFKSKIQAKYADFLVIPTGEVNADEVKKKFEEVYEASKTADPADETKKVQYRGPSVTIYKELPIEDLSSEESQFNSVINLLYKFMLSEPKIISEKDAERSFKDRDKILKKGNYLSIVQNRVGKKFYCKMTADEFKRRPGNSSITDLLDMETFEVAKYIRLALTFVETVK